MDDTPNLIHCAAVSTLALPQSEEETVSNLSCVQRPVPNFTAYTRRVAPSKG